MKFQRQFRETLKALMAALAIVVFTLSLVLPYSSAYYSKDRRVSQQLSTSASDEKVEVSTDLLASPAECLNTKLIQRFHSVDRIFDAIQPRQIVTIFNSFIRHGKFIGVFSIRPLPWQPSIVIALRKLLI